MDHRFGLAELALEERPHRIVAKLEVKLPLFDLCDALENRYERDALMGQETLQRCDDFVRGFFAHARRISRVFHLSRDATSRDRSGIPRRGLVITPGEFALRTAPRRAHQAMICGASSSRDRNALRSLSSKKEQMYSAAQL